MPKSFVPYTDGDSFGIRIVPFGREYEDEFWNENQLEVTPKFGDAKRALIANYEHQIAELRRAVARVRAYRLSECEDKTGNSES